MEAEMTKQEARERMKRLRRELSVEERQRKDQMIRERLLHFAEGQEKPWIFSFVSYRTEVDTHFLIQQLLEEKKMRVAVPRVVGKEIEFYAISSMEDLKPGYQGIPEPVTKECVTASDGILLLPGLAFDRRKNRVGYGGGFYDRYLQREDLQELVTVALAYDFQIVDRIRAEETDRKPQWILTDKEIF